MPLNINRKIGAPLVRFDPESYKRAYARYRQGIWRDIIEMMNRAETDSHVAGCLLGRRAGYQVQFSVSAFEDSASDIERAQQIESVIKNLDHRRLFKSIQEAVLKKFSVIDFEWDMYNNLQAPVEFEKLEHKYFRYDPKDGILKIDNGKTLEEITEDSGALVCETRDVPMLFPVLRDYILKEFGLESFAGFIETFGEPFVIGKYPPGTQKTQRTELDTAINNIARSARGVMPKDSDIEILETNRNTGDHEKFIELANRGVSISILGHANAVEQSKSLQVGENLTQYEVKREIAVDDMFYIDACMQELIRKIYDMNWADARYPVFELDKKKQPLIKDQLDILDLLYRHGVTIHPDEYKKLGAYIFPEQEAIVRVNPFGDISA